MKNVAFIIFIMGIFATLSGFSAEVEPSKSSLPEAFLHIRDPFKQGVLNRKEQSLKSELEAYPTEKFTLVGVISGLNETRAMLLAPNQQTYVVTQNMKIGLRKGFIQKITPSKVLVREKVLNLLGQEEEVEVDLPLDNSADQNQPGGSVW